MPDTFSRSVRSWIMSCVPSKGTRPERIAADALRSEGIRYQSHRKDLPGHPDFVITNRKLAIFVNGCFWHWHGCFRCTVPNTNRAFWEAKIDRNIARDKQVRIQLHRLGWKFVTVWECDLQRGLTRCIRRIKSLDT